MCTVVDLAVCWGGGRGRGSGGGRGPVSIVVERGIKTMWAALRRGSTAQFQRRAACLPSTAALPWPTQSARVNRLWNTARPFSQQDAEQLDPSHPLMQFFEEVDSDKDINTTLRRAGRSWKMEELRGKVRPHHQRDSSPLSLCAPAVFRRPAQAVVCAG